MIAMKEADLKIDLKQDIGHRILLLRTYKKLSQAELASMIGCTQRMISVWETGAKQPRLEQLVKMCRLFSIGLGFFDPDVDVAECMQYLVNNSKEPGNANSH